MTVYGNIQDLWLNCPPMRQNFSCLQIIYMEKTVLVGQLVYYKIQELETRIDFFKTKSDKQYIHLFQRQFQMEIDHVFLSLL